MLAHPDYKYGRRKPEEISRRGGKKDGKKDKKKSDVAVPAPDDASLSNVVPVANVAPAANVAAVTNHATATNHTPTTNHAPAASVPNDFPAPNGIGFASAAPGTVAGTSVRGTVAGGAGFASGESNGVLVNDPIFFQGSDSPDNPNNGLDFDFNNFDFNPGSIFHSQK